MVIEKRVYLLMIPVLSAPREFHSTHRQGKFCLTLHGICAVAQRELRTQKSKHSDTVTLKINGSRFWMFLES